MLAPEVLRRGCIQLHVPAQAVDSRGGILVAVLSPALFIFHVVSHVVEIVEDVPVPIVLIIIFLEVGRPASKTSLTLRDISTVVFVRCNEVHHKAMVEDQELNELDSL